MIALNASFYDCYAQIIDHDCIDEDLSKNKFIAISVARKDHFNYVHNHDQIMSLYQNSIADYGRYSKEIALNMGDSYYFGRFDSVEQALEFQKFIQQKY